LNLPALVTLPAVLDLCDLSAEELATCKALAYDAYHAARGIKAKRRARLTLKPLISEGNRRDWNALSIEERAEQCMYGLQQGEAEWYGGEDSVIWCALQDWLGGLLGTAEACEASGQSLDPR